MAELETHIMDDSVKLNEECWLASAVCIFMLWFVCLDKMKTVPVEAGYRIPRFVSSVLF